MSTINLRDFPEDLHRLAKSEAALMGISLKELIISALTGYLKNKKRGGEIAYGSNPKTESQRQRATLVSFHCPQWQAEVHQGGQQGCCR
jgi:hypothetical protein